MSEHSDQGVCAQCHRDCHEQPRQLDDSEMLWLHAECEAAFLQQRLAEEGLAATPSSNGADHDAASLEPNLADINKHLYAIFNPDFVRDYPDAWIEIAIGDPKAAPGMTGPRAAKHFSPFKLEEAAAYAMRRNKEKNSKNIYIGVALRKGEAGPTGRATKKNVVTACRGWGDFDKAGDDIKVQTSLQQKGLESAEMILTGSIPHNRFQIFFRLAGTVTPDQLEAVNAAIRDDLGGNGDGVQNADRVMRLAGTVSYPPPHKVARGYVPELTKLFAKADARAYPVDELLQRLAPNKPLNHFQQFGREARMSAGDSDAAAGHGGGRSDREIEALLETSRTPGKWHNAMRSAVATMIGRGWSDSAIRLVCGPYCEAGAGSTNLDDFINRARTKWDVPNEEPGVATQVSSPVEPIDLWGRFEPPDLPRGLLPPLIEEFAFERSEMLGCDPSGLAVGALATCAGAIPDNIRLQPKHFDTEWTESARLWVLLDGDPSTMKTPMILACTKPLRRINAEMAAQYQREMAAYLQLPKDPPKSPKGGAAQLVKIGVAQPRDTRLPEEEYLTQKTVDKPEKRRAMIFDTTIEAVQEILKDSPDGVLLEDDELSGWFDAMYKYNGARGAQKDRSFWMQAYNGGPKTVDRITRGTVHIANLSVSILGGIQPGPIRKLADAGEDDGLLQRFLPIELRPAVGGQDKAPGAATADYDSLIQALRKSQFGIVLRDPTTLLKFDDGALKIREELERKHLDLMQLEGLNRKLTSHFGKYNGIFARLCVVWHCINYVSGRSGGAWSGVVSENTARQVADFMHGFLRPHAVAFYTGVLGLSNDHDRLANVADFILAHRLESISNRDVARGDRSMRGLQRHETEAIFEQLEALGWTKKSGLRRSDPPHWAVNPLVHERFAGRAEASEKRRESQHELISDVLGKGET